MKRLILLLLIAGSLASCSKDNSPDNSTCWKCTFGMVNGYQKPDTTFCNNGQTPGQFYTTDGTPIQSQCLVQ